MFSAKLLDHFEHPRFAGELKDPSHRAVVENPACGDVLELALRVEGGRIAACAFKAKGCVPAMACASALTEAIYGKSLSEASAISRDDVRRMVESVPPASGHALDLAVDALRAALASAVVSRG